jgi:hypothetical protein
MTRQDGPVEAEVEAGGSRIPYLRAGRGLPALLLRARPTPGDPELAELARTFRVHLLLRPPPPGGGEAEDWLRRVVEGLGLREPEVFADAALAPTLSHLVARNGGFVGRVTFLAGSDPG